MIFPNGREQVLKEVVQKKKENVVFLSFQKGDDLKKDLNDGQEPEKKSSMEKGLPGKLGRGHPQTIAA